MIIPKTKLDMVLKIFNNYHQLKFTYELESNNLLNFLNTLVIREGKKLIIHIRIGIESLHFLVVT